MKLAAYRASRGLSHDQMAELVGLASPHRARAVRRWENGERIPRAAQMAKISVATAGTVTPSDFFDLPTDAPAGLTRATPHTPDSGAA
ncbi:helix-turn-helix transcriptional regulator [Teichococcus deserti]|uniref:helix-turn-helix transcriptional regulator n=1 Tax=Teichococcus deserti TaxID=1817963 RepID=UPI0009774089